VVDDRDKALLDFERAWQGKSTGKEDAIRQAFGFSPARYSQLMVRLVRTQEAMEYDPELVTRLARLYERREAARASAMNPTLKKNTRE
jgi:hypothetical protein